MEGLFSLFYGLHRLLFPNIFPAQFVLRLLRNWMSLPRPGQILPDDPVSFLLRFIIPVLQGLFPQDLPDLLRNRMAWVPAPAGSDVVRGVQLGYIENLPFVQFPKLALLQNLEGKVLHAVFLDRGMDQPAPSPVQILMLNKPPFDVVALSDVALAVHKIRDLINSNHADHHFTTHLARYSPVD